MKVQQRVCLQRKQTFLDRCDPIAYNNNNNLKIKKDIVASEYVIGDDKQVSGQGKTVETVLSDIEVDESDLTYKQKQERIITKY